MGQTFETLYTPEDRAAREPERSLRIARREEKYVAEGWHIHRSGTRFLVSVVIGAIYDGGRLIGFVQIIRDITERQTAQSALAESERQFSLLVSNVTDYALYMLDPEGRVSSWNAGGERIKGYKAEEIIGEHFSRFYTATDQAAGRPARVLATARDNVRTHAETSPAQWECYERVELQGQSDAAVAAAMGYNLLSVKRSRSPLRTPSS